MPPTMNIPQHRTIPDSLSFHNSENIIINNSILIIIIIIIIILIVILISISIYISCPYLMSSLSTITRHTNIQPDIENGSPHKKENTSPPSNQNYPSESESSDSDNSNNSSETRVILNSSEKRGVSSLPTIL